MSISTEGQAKCFNSMTSCDIYVEFKQEFKLEKYLLCENHEYRRATFAWITQESQRLLADTKGWKETKGFVTCAMTTEWGTSFTSCLNAQTPLLWISDKNTYQSFTLYNLLFGKWYYYYKLRKQKLFVNWELSWTMFWLFLSNLQITNAWQAMPHFFATSLLHWILYVYKIHIVTCIAFIL